MESKRYTTNEDEKESQSLSLSVVPMEAEEGIVAATEVIDTASVEDDTVAMLDGDAVTTKRSRGGNAKLVASHLSSATMADVRRPTIESNTLEEAAALPTTESGGGSGADRAISTDELLEDTTAGLLNAYCAALPLSAGTTATTGMRKKTRRKRAATAADVGAVPVSTSTVYRGLRRGKHKKGPTTVTWTRGVGAGPGNTSQEISAAAIDWTTEPMASNTVHPTMRGLRKNRQNHHPRQVQHSPSIDQMEEGSLQASIPDGQENSRPSSGLCECIPPGSNARHNINNQVQDSRTIEQIEEGSVQSSSPEALQVMSVSPVLSDQLPPGSNPSHSTVGLTPITQNGIRVSNADLAVAQPVEDGRDASLMQAVEVDPEELERKAVERKKNRECIAIGIVLMVLALAAMLGAIFGRSSKDSTGIATVPTAAPSVVPSKCPSSAPTGILDLLLEGLPNYTLQSLQNSSTPQWNARAWLQSHPELPEMEEWRKKQFFALATFYHAMDGPNWPEAIRDNWMQHDKSECYWHSSEFGLFSSVDGKYQEEDPTYNITPCNDRGEIQTLALANLGLSHYETFLPPEIALLTALSVLALPGNGVTAPITEFLPSELFQMTNLTVLNLHSNALSGQVPSALGLLSSMKTLGLEKNAFTGPIPSEVGLMTSMTQLYLSRNSLSGPIPREVGAISAMVELALYENALTGPIPSEVGLMTSMTELKVYSNNFSGPIPSEVGVISTMVVLALHENELMGLIPSEVGLMTSMTLLYLHSNTLSGPIPSEVGEISTMVELSLRDNALTGRIPSEVGLMTSMTKLFLSSNHFSGPIPSEVGEISTMVDLSLRDNALTGPIPSEMGAMTSMTQLFL